MSVKIQNVSTAFPFMFWVQTMEFAKTNSRPQKSPPAVKSLKESEFCVNDT